MYNDRDYYSRPYYPNRPIYTPYDYPYWVDMPMYSPDYWRKAIPLRDYGPEPFVVNIEQATLQNDNFRIALWTGEHLQLTLMSIDVGEDIGLEMHPDVDQFIRIEQGQGLVMMGDDKDNLYYRRRVYEDYAILIPAGKWHNLINTGRVPLKLYSIYAPPEHPRGTVHETKEDAQQHHK
ncbi:cupin domain-containing protein [Caldicoprobacter faecalis]|uniref:Mannose-6-phosphate isomerase, cupin superfamily n=1 Tax=Caldicoprobacter faecalis TaxID=937334 RepID=A0A1I5SUL0_9FIRM|nr:cupin domain-containing protein [Caldicoprobacter faecalis]PZN08966.1 MAG: cupin domain-containing protein [Caldicoprobacter oshimai]SFP74429.1 Mannose-6-phosphate isomerase, cupin superfamily [Caldicoprobacter faecalis]